MRRTRRHAIVSILTVMLALAILGARPTQDTPSGLSGKGEPVTYPNSQTEQLRVFVGAWRVVEKHFDTRGEVIATVKGTEEIAWLLDRHALRRTYTTWTDASTFNALGTLAYDSVKKVYQCVWFNNKSVSGPNILSGQWDNETKTMTFSTEALSPLGKVDKYKIVEQFLDDERRQKTTYQVRGSEVIKKSEVLYVRAVPCPDKIMIIPGRS